MAGSGITAARAARRLVAMPSSQAGFSTISAKVPAAPATSSPRKPTTTTTGRRPLAEAAATPGGQHDRRHPAGAGAGQGLGGGGERGSGVAPGLAAAGGRRKALHA